MTIENRIEPFSKQKGDKGGWWERREIGDAKNVAFTEGEMTKGFPSTGCRGLEKQDSDPIHRTQWL